MPFEHALVSLDDGRRLSTAENPPLHNSREPIGSSPNWGRPVRAGPARPSSWRCGSPLWPRVLPSFSSSAAPSWRWLDWSRGRTCNGTGTHVKPVRRSNWGARGLPALAGWTQLRSVLPVRPGLPSAEHQGVRALPAVQRRRDHLGGREAVRRLRARPANRIRGAVRIRGRADWPGCLAAAPPRRLSTRKDCEDTSMSVWTPVENPGTRRPRSGPSTSSDV
jgi:hypothetical protein